MNIVIVSGMSGSGKTQASHALEDLGYYCIDNMPPKLIKNFIDLTDEQNSEVEKAAFIIDVRGGALLNDIKEVLREIEKDKIPHKIIFLEASDKQLIQRYSETRRIHPLAVEGSTADGIRKERERLEKLRSEADFIIDTSNMKPADLYRKIKGMFSAERKLDDFAIHISSFGYKNGIPLGADFVIDVRFVPNPYYIPELKHLTGNDKAVSDYVLKQKATEEFITKMNDMLIKLIPYYLNEGKYHLNVAFGCTGGQHRSVAIANEMGRVLEAEGKNVTVKHRDS